MARVGRSARDRARELTAQLDEAKRQNDQLRSEAQAELAKMSVERDRRLRQAEGLAHELIENAPQRAREMGLILPEPEAGPDYEEPSPGI